MTDSAPSLRRNSAVIAQCGMRRADENVFTCHSRQSSSVTSPRAPTELFAQEFTALSAVDRILTASHSTYKASEPCILASEPIPPLSTPAKPPTPSHTP